MPSGDKNAAHGEELRQKLLALIYHCQENRRRFPRVATVARAVGTTEAAIHYQIGRLVKSGAVQRQGCNEGRSLRIAS
jgi:hypothetical protein